MPPSDLIAGDRRGGIYNSANGWLTYDSNGNANGGTQVHFATLGANLALTECGHFGDLIREG
jgi:hypothetical protein